MKLNFLQLLLLITPLWANVLPIKNEIKFVTTMNEWKKMKIGTAKGQTIRIRPVVVHKGAKNKEYCEMEIDVHGGTKSTLKTGLLLKKKNAFGAQDFHIRVDAKDMKIRAKSFSCYKATLSEDGKTIEKTERIAVPEKVNALLTKNNGVFFDFSKSKIDFLDFDAKEKNYVQVMDKNDYALNPLKDDWFESGAKSGDKLKFSLAGAIPSEIDQTQLKFKIEIGKKKYTVDEFNQKFENEMKLEPTRNSNTFEHTLEILKDYKKGGKARSLEVSVFNGDAIYVKKTQFFKKHKELMSCMEVFFLMVGIMFAVVGAYFAFLWFTGDIGSRPKLFANAEEFEFSRVRAFFWPIYGFEMAKLIPLAVLFFCSLFVYVAQRDIKDSILVEAPREDGGFTMGNIANSWAKLLGVLPFAIMSSAVILKLLQKYQFTKVSYLCIGFFATYFFLNSLLIYPNRSALRIVPLERWIQGIESKIAQDYALGIVGLLVYWPTSVHYIMSELWGTITLSFCCWGYINLMTKKKDARRWYPSIALPAQFAQMLAAQTVDQMVEGAKTKMWSFETALVWMNVTNLVVSIIFASTFFWLQNYVKHWDRFVQEEGAVKKKAKIGTCGAMKFAFTNYHALCIAGIVFFYGATNVIQEVTYKDLFSAQFNFDKAEMASFKAKESLLVAVVTFLSMLFVGSNFLDKFGWLTTAFALPAIMSVIGVGFYICTLSTDVAEETIFFPGGEPKLGEIGTGAGTTSGSAWNCVYLGLVLIVLSKSLKYSLFDPTKEMAYLPFSKAEKSNAKAVADIIGARGGKSFGSLFNVIVVSSVGGKGFSTNFVIAAFIVVAAGLVMWFVSAFFLDRFIKQRELKNKEEAAEEKKNEVEDPACASFEIKEVVEEKATDNSEKKVVELGNLEDVELDGTSETNSANEQSE